MTDLGLVYLDPPFNGNRDPNVIFRDESGNATDATRSIRAAGDGVDSILALS